MTDREKPKFGAGGPEFAMSTVRQSRSDYAAFTTQLSAS